MPNNLEIRSEEVQDILGYVPNWMIRWGNTLIFVLIIGFLLMSWFIKYPDTIPGEIIITTEEPPEKVRANSSGLLEAVFVKDGDFVRPKTLLGIIENSANYQDVTLLQHVLDTLEVDEKNFSFPLDNLPILFLGDMASEYAMFERDYIKYMTFKNQNHLSIDAFHDNRSLHSKLQPPNARQNLYIANGPNNIDTAILNDEKVLLKKAMYSLGRLKKAMQRWHLKYTLRSSTEGQVFCLNDIDKTQKVDVGDEVFKIVPTGNQQRLIGKLKTQAQGYGKLKLGQTVHIKLANYPYLEFGFLNGTIEKIAEIANDDGTYTINVTLPKQLITSHKKEINFQQEMKGSADIVTEDLRLIERFFYKLRNIFK